MRLSTFLVATLLAAPAAAQQSTATENEIVVTAERTAPGSVFGDIQPETTLRADQVRALGASTVDGVLTALASQTGSASGRGGGRPIVLLNGRRIGGFHEIRDIPSEAIARVEVFDEQLSLQYGFSPDQRVMNVVLRPRYRANTLEAAAGFAADGARDTSQLDASTVDINRDDRLTVSGRVGAASAVTELERGVEAPASGNDERASRTLAPDEQNWRLNANYSHPLAQHLTLGLNARTESAEQETMLGIDSSTLQPILRRQENQNLSGAASLNGDAANWQWTATAAAELTAQESAVGDDERTSSNQTTIDFTANANGPIFEVPAGPVRMNGRLTLNNQSIDASTFSGSATTHTRLERQLSSGRFGLFLPVTSRRREFGAAFGDFFLNATANWSELSDFGSLSGHGAGMMWSPAQGLRFSLQAEETQAAPSLQQLGNPVETTPNALFYDFATGSNVSITQTSGGNQALIGEDRNDLTFNAFWSPHSIEGLSFTLGWARNESENVAAVLPVNLPETEAAFPSRYTRDLSGTLVTIDIRPVNLASRETEFARLGVTYTHAFGPRIEPTPGSPPWGNGMPPWGSAQPPWGAGPPPAPGAGGGPPPGLGGPGGRREMRPGRTDLSLAYRERLADEVVLAAGLAPINLLDRGGLASGGEAQGTLEFESGVSYRGLGLRLSGNWTSGYNIPIASSGGALSFSDRTTLNLRAFVDFNQRRELLETAPALSGARLQLSIDNLAESAIEVRDSAGLTPAAYQEGYLVPLGRVVQLSLRKQF